LILFCNQHCTLQVNMASDGNGKLKISTNSTSHSNSWYTFHYGWLSYYTLCASETYKPWITIPTRNYKPWLSPCLSIRHSTTRNSARHAFVCVLLSRIKSRQQSVLIQGYLPDEQHITTTRMIPTEPWKARYSPRNPPPPGRCQGGRAKIL
jgi:hypothetical protein